MNDEFRRQLTSGNGTEPRGGLDRHPGNQQERKQNLKYAIFYLVVAVLLFLANQLAKHPRADGSQSDAVLNVGFDLSLGRKPEPIRARNDSAEEATYVIRFRLTNRGNQSVFYPVYPGTNRPIGRIVYRVAPGSEWIALSWPEKPISPPPALSSAEGDFAWVEMPPGGWVDDVYDDPGTPGGDHAYEVDLKVATNDKVTRFLSQPYPVKSN